MSEEESLITEAMVKKATYLIHKLADQRNETFETIRNKCKKMFGYMNLAKLSLDDGHAMISKLIEVTGGEEEEGTPQLPKKPDDGSPKREITKQPAEKEEEIRTEEDVVTATMRKAIRAAVDITQKEVIEKDIPVMGLGGFVLEVGKVLFEAKMAEEVV